MLLSPKEVFAGCARWWRTLREEKALRMPNIRYRQEGKKAPKKMWKTEQNRMPAAAPAVGEVERGTTRLDCG
jgi:hypothetical protein